MITIFNKRLLVLCCMSDQINKQTHTNVGNVMYDVNDNNNQTQTNETQTQAQTFELLKNLLNNPTLKICYKCKQDFSNIIDEGNNNGSEESNESNNILFGGIVLSQQTPCSICLKCLSSKMLDVLTEQFTKNNKDYYGLFSSYKEKYKV